MAVVTYEHVDSRERANGGVDRIYIARGSDSDIDIKTQILADAPSTHDGFNRKDGLISCSPLRITGAGDGWWLVTVPYSVGAWGFNVGSESYTFDTSGGTQHITHSRGMVAKYAASGTAPDIGTSTGGGPIGATADGVAGVDIPVPQFEWEETHIFSWGSIDNTYKDRLAELTGRINNASFKGSQAKEVLFLGCRGARLPDNTAALTFKFAKSRNATGLEVGSITGIAKKGWEYLDVKYETKELGSGADKILVQQPKYVYIHKIFVDDDFSALGIGT